MVHHTPSPATHGILHAVLDGTGAEGLADVEVVVRPALAATAVDVLGADGVLVGTPANLGYMSGALKHFFDLIYYPCLDASRKLPYGAWVHGDDDTGGAIAGIEKITTGLQWRAVQPPLSLTGKPDAADRDAAWELGAAVAATLLD